MHALKKLASETAIYGVSTIIMRMLNYLMVPLYTALFNPAAYGVVTLFYAVIAFFNILLTYGMETTYFRFADTEKRAYSTALNSVILTALVFLLLTWFQADFLAALLNEVGRSELIKYSILILFFDAIMAIPFARLRKLGKAKRFVWLRSLSIVLNILLNLLFIYFGPKWVESGWNPMGLFPAEPDVKYIFVANLVASAITFLLMLPDMREVNKGIDYALWKRMLRYTAPLLFVGFAGMVNETFDRVALDYLLPQDVARHQLGVYAACYKLSILMSLFIQAFRFAAEPFFFSQKDKGDRKVYAQVTHYFALFCFAVFLMVTLYLDFFKLFLRSDAYYEGLAVVPVLLLANLFLGVYYNLSIWYKLADKTIIGAYISGFGALLTVVLLLVLVPVLGYMGAAYTTLVVYGLMMVLAYFTGQKHYPIPYQVRSFFFYLILTLLIFLAGEVINLQLNTHVYLWKSILFIGFLLVVWLIEKPRKMITSHQK